MPSPRRKQQTTPYAPAGTGRPSLFSAELADAICERIADGESLKAICADEGMPNRSTVFRWLADDGNTTFRDMYARAREEQAETLADDLVGIADREGATSADSPVATARDKLRVDTRKWIAAKLKPKKYGERVQHANDPDNPMPATITIVGVEPAK